MNLFAKKPVPAEQPDIGAMRPYCDAIRAAQRRVDAARAERDKIVHAIDNWTAAAATADGQRAALGERIREGALAVALADGDDGPDLAALRADEDRASRRHSELSRTVVDLEAKRGAATTTLGNAEDALRVANVDAMHAYANAVVVPEYERAAQSFVTAARAVFATERLLGSATGTSPMLLTPGARRDTYVPDVVGATNEAIYRGPDFDVTMDRFLGNWTRAIEIQRERLATIGIAL